MILVGLVAVAAIVLSLIAINQNRGITADTPEYTYTPEPEETSEGDGCRYGLKSIKEHVRIICLYFQNL